MTLRYGLIGLGTMGVPMAQNIAAAGHALTVFNRSPEKARVFEETDVAIAASAAALFEASDVIVLMLKDGTATDAVLGRKGDEFAARMTGKTVVMAATVSPGYSERLGAAVEKAGGAYVEGPVSGSEAPAKAGALLVMSAGAEKDVARARPVFDAVGKETVYCGRTPAAMYMKCATNLMLGGIMAGMAESWNFAEKSGLDLDLFTKLILGGQMGSDFLRMKLPKALAEDYEPQAAVYNVRYSHDVLRQAAAEANIPATIPSRIVELCDEAASLGFAEEDVIALLKAARAEKTGRAQ